MSKLNKHKLLMYKIEVASINNRTKVKINHRYKLDRIEYPYFDKKSATLTELASVKTYDLLDLLDIFCKEQEKKGDILDSTQNIAYEYINHRVDKSKRRIMVKINRGEYGTVRQAKDTSPTKQDLQLEKKHAVYEPFYLVIYLPKNYSEGLLFSINKGLTSVRAQFIREFILFFNKKFPKNLRFRCDIFTSPEVYKEWLDSDLVSLTATVTIDTVKDPANKLNEFPSLTTNTQYKKEVTVKPATTFELKNFLKPITNKGQGIALTDTYTQEFEEYDEVKANMSKDGMNKSFVLKTDNPLLENSFSIPLMGLQYNVADNHPKQSSIATESDKIYTDHKRLIS